MFSFLSLSPRAALRVGMFWQNLLSRLVSLPTRGLSQRELPRGSHRTLTPFSRLSVFTMTGDGAREQPQAVAEQDGPWVRREAERGVTGRPGQVDSSWLAMWKALEVVVR